MSAGRSGIAAVTTLLAKDPSQFEEAHPWAHERYLDPRAPGGYPFGSRVVARYWEKIFRRLEGDTSADTTVIGTYPDALTPLATLDHTRADTEVVVLSGTASTAPRWTRRPSRCRRTTGRPCPSRSPASGATSGSTHRREASRGLGASHEAPNRRREIDSHALRHVAVEGHHRRVHDALRSRVTRAPTARRRRRSPRRARRTTRPMSRPTSPSPTPAQAAAARRPARRTSPTRAPPAQAMTTGGCTLAAKAGGSGAPAATALAAASALLALRRRRR